MSTAKAVELPKLSRDSFLPARSEIKELNEFVRPETKDLVATLLYDNHEKHHCFFNTKGLHNHAIHQMIAGLTVGASPNEIQRHYDYQLEHVLSSFSLSDRKQYDPFVSDHDRKIEKITESNWTEHVGNARYYWSYLHFFDSQVASHGMAAALERFVFASEANKPGVGMVNRFFGGVIHALIHCGYGAELKTSGIVAEGLAMATSTALKYDWLFDQSWLHSSPPTDGANKRMLPIISDILRDDRLCFKALDLEHAEAGLEDKAFKQGGSAHGLIHHYANQWVAVQSSDTIQTDVAIHDLSLLSALLLGAVPKKPDGGYHHDFFLMHLNNAHLFTPLFLSLLEPKTQVVFLRALVTQFLFYFIARGRPRFSPAHWITEKEVANDLDWPTLFRAATSNVDEHCVKAVRSLYVFSIKAQGDPLQEMVHAGLIDGEAAQPLGSSDPFLLTARQIVRMHQGKIRPSKHSADLVGADTEYWDFDKFVYQ